VKSTAQYAKYLRWCLRLERFLLLCLAAEVPLALAFRWEDWVMLQVWAVGAVLFGVCESCRVFLVSRLRRLLWK
jgi:hypothetical protein